MFKFGMLRYNIVVVDERIRKRRRRRRNRRLATAFVGILLTVGSCSTAGAFESSSTRNFWTARIHPSKPKSSAYSSMPRRSRGVSPWLSPSKQVRHDVYSARAKTKGQDEHRIIPSHTTASKSLHNRNVSNLYFIDVLDGSDNHHHHNHETPAQKQHQRNGNRLSLVTTRKLWKRRHARTAEEGIRRERTSNYWSPSSTSTKLSSLLIQAQQQRDAAAAATAQIASSVLSRNGGNIGSGPGGGNSYAARTITGLINALAREVNDLEVQVETRPDTPLWGKQVDAVRIQFSRLGFEPLRMGGLLPPSSSPSQDEKTNQQPNQELLISSGDAASSTVTAEFGIPASSASPSLTSSPVDFLSIDEAFARMDSDNSGALDMNELAQVLNHVAGSPDSVQDDKLMEDLATQLVELYDANGDGVVDRYEYQSMVEDMAAIRRAQQERFAKKGNGFFSFDAAMLWQFLKNSFLGRFLPGNNNNSHNSNTNTNTTVSSAYAETMEQGYTPEVENKQVNITAAPLDTLTKALGYITFSDLKLDLRRLVFGAVPILKHITPGGPLVLEPFTTTVAGSFTREDVMESRLLDAGLRDLIGRALRRRVRNFRDFVDGAVFFGRTWKMSSSHAPVVEVSRLTNVEFDAKNRMIVTGRVRIRHSPDAPIIENAFKVRTQLGTRKNGQVIRLVDPELALVLECPRAWERHVNTVHKRFGLPKPKRPEPLYFFFPMYSPFRVEDKDGFDLGEDNCIKAIGVQDGALRFEMSAVVRPGRFLGNHYLAFTLPKRTFIITLDRVREGIRAARRAKREKERLTRESADGQSGDKILEVRKDSQSEKDDDWDWMDTWATNTSSGSNRSDPAATNKVTIKTPKSFFSRFVEGYNEAGGKSDDESGSRSEGLSVAISEWFGRQQPEDNGKSLKP